MMMKTCSKCKIEKELGEFHKNKSMKDGLQYQCKECVREYQQDNKEATTERNRKYYQENKEVRAEYNREYYQKNKEYYAEHSRKYYQENKEYFVEYDRKYRQDNKEALAGYGRKYHQENKEVRSEYQRKHYQENKEYYTEYNQKYQQDNKETIAKRKRKYRQENKEALAECNRRWRQTSIGREKSKANNTKYRAIESGLEGHYTAEQFIELCNLADNECVCCGGVQKLTVDHIIPITWENSNNFITNIQPLCKPCNSSKGNHHATDYRSEEIKEWSEEQVE